MLFALILTVIDYDTGNELLRINSIPKFDSVAECRNAGVDIAKSLSEFYRHTYHNASTNIICREGE